MSDQASKPAPGIVFTISAVLDGFPISVAFDTSRADVHQVIGRLQDLGCTPPTTALPLSTAVSMNAPGEIPKCIYHGTMKESTKVPGTFFCSKKLSDDTYCKEKWPAKG